MKVKDPSALLVQWFHHKTPVPPERRRVFIVKSYRINYPKCNNNHLFYRYGKDPDGYQKYLCRNCKHQFAPEPPRVKEANCRPKHPTCPVCGNTSFLHHDYEHYSNYRCCDKKCNHSFFSWKAAAINDNWRHNFATLYHFLMIYESYIALP
jgi:hypothetical protein